jgi:hypothetical protein
MKLCEKWLAGGWVETSWVVWISWPNCQLPIAICFFFSAE